MGVGKTSLGRIVAPRLSLVFVDVDALVERQADMSVVDIFARFGEAEFRRGEANVLREVVERNEGVLVATGGGAFIEPEGKEIMRKAGITVWLDVPLGELDKRPGGETRPLWADEEARRRLLDERLAHYREADLHLDLRSTPLDEAADRLYRLLAPLCEAS